MNIMQDYLITGVGGQGTVLASKMIAAAAINHGLKVRTTETIGMAQRGGSVVSHVRIGDIIHSPLIPLGKADAIIAFEPVEAVRCFPYLSPHGKMIVCDTIIKTVAPTTTDSAHARTQIAGNRADTAGTGAADADAADAPPADSVESILEYIKSYMPDAVVLPGDRIKEYSAKTLNVAILGAAAEYGLFPFSVAALKEVILTLLPQRFWDVNTKSFELGRLVYNEIIG